MKLLCILLVCTCHYGLPWWLRGKQSACQCRCGFEPWGRKIPWRRKWQPTPVFLSEKSHGQGSLADYSPWSHRVGQDLMIKQQQTHVIVRLSKLRAHTTKSEPQRKLWAVDDHDVLMQVHQRQGTALVGSLDTGEGCACVGAEDSWGISVPSAQHCDEPNTALEIKSVQKTENSKEWQELKCP